MMTFLVTVTDGRVSVQGLVKTEDLPALPDPVKIVADKVRNSLRFRSSLMVEVVAILDPNIQPLDKFTGKADEFFANLDSHRLADWD